MPGFPDMLAGGGSPSTKGIGCTVCKVVVAVIRFEVKTVNATEQTIKKSVEALCALYPIKAAQDAVRIILNCTHTTLFQRSRILIQNTRLFLEMLFFLGTSAF